VQIQLIGGRYVVVPGSERSGGMGKVFKVRDAHTDRLCAIKVLDVFRRDSELHKMAMRRDLEALRELHNHNILALIDYGIDDQHGPYVVTEWLEQDLDSYCSATPFSDWQMFWTRVGSPVLSALCYALMKGRVHRDLKPANLMFDAQGTIRVIDFGISAVVDRLNLGATLGRQVSGVYSPPEGPDAKNLLRDVYGFAATVVYAMSGRPILDRDQLLAELQRISLPIEIRDVLASALSADADERPEDVFHLQSQLIALSAGIEAPAAARRPIVLLHVPRGVLTKAGNAIGTNLTVANCIGVLNKLTYIEKPRVPFPSDKQRVDLITEELAISVSKDPSNPAIWIARSIFETRPTRWSWAQERGLESTVEFRESASDRDRSPISERAIDGLLDVLDEQTALVVQGNGSLFDTWRAVLRGKSEYYGKLYPTIHVKRFRIEGQRIFCQLSGPPDINIVGLHYFVSDGVERVTSAVVESTQDDEVVVYSAFPFASTLLVDDGVLQYNSFGTEKAAKHQEAALDRIQAGAGPIPDLATYLIDPSLIPPPQRIDYVPILDHLDKDKKTAAAGAAGADPIFLIVGPPGTGKTELIAEIVLQELKSNPNARILLSAQTHMAVDNALSRLRQVDSQIRCIRLGRSQDKISRDIADLQLERAAPDWRRRVVSSCTSAVDAYCSERGVDAGELRARRVVIAAYEAETSVRSAGQLLADTKARIIKLQEAPQPADAIAPELDAQQEVLIRATAELERAELRSSEALIQLHAVGDPAVALLEQVRNGAPLAKLDTGAEDTSAVLTIVADWMQRLAVSQEFFPAILAEAQVVAGTCLGFIGVPGTEEIRYDLAIVEEASRALPSELLVPGSKAKRIILVGDGKQLPPFIESALLSNDWLEPNNLSKDEVLETLFSRLETRMPSETMHRLKMQYRMIKPISDLIESVFYPGALEPAPDAGARAVTLSQLGLSRNVVFISTAREKSRRETAEEPGYSNACEVRTVRKFLQLILSNARKKRLKNFSVVVLTPYVAQRTALEQAIAHLRGDHPDVAVSAHTIHTFQGKQADIAIYSAVRSNAAGDLGFTDDARLLNVGLSRGRGGLAIIGDAQFLANQRASWAYKAVLDHVKANPSSCLLKDSDHV